MYIFFPKVTYNFATIVLRVKFTINWFDWKAKCSAYLILLTLALTGSVWMLDIFIISDHIHKLLQGQPFFFLYA